MSTLNVQANWYSGNLSSETLIHTMNRCDFCNRTMWFMKLVFKSPKEEDIKESCITCHYHPVSVTGKKWTVLQVLCFVNIPEFEKLLGNCKR